MHASPQAEEVQASLNRLRPGDNSYASDFVERLLEAAREVHASDLDLQPTPQGLEVRWRLDGVL